MSKSILVVGQGLAGSLLAWQLLSRNHSVHVIDPGENNASRVAAGLINPVSGQRLVKAPAIAQHLPCALWHYRQLGRQLNKTVYHALPMRRLLNSSRLIDYAQRRLQDRDYLKWLSHSPTDKPSGCSAIMQHHTGFLNTRLLLNEIQQWLIRQQRLAKTQFDYANFDPAQPCWQHLKFDHVVFCEGHQLHSNPWFNYLPLIPVKGEILTCHSQTQIEHEILNYGNWIIPNDAFSFRLGTTQEPNNRCQLANDSTRQTLIEQLASVRPMLANNLLVSEHQVGIRPSTLDKQPLIGRHPEHTKLFVFNGFGSKGSLSIPWYAVQMADLLTTGNADLGEADIRRFDHVR